MRTDSVDEAFNNAVSLEKSGNLKEAVKLYLSILARDKKHKGSYINLGSIYSKTDRLPDAVRCFSRALALGHDYMTHFNLGCIYYKMAQYKKSVMHLEKSRSINGSFLHTSLVLGLSYSKLKNIRAAESNFSDVLKIDPSQRIAATALAILYHNEKKHSLAMELLEQLAEKDRESAAVRELKSEILYETGKIDESAREIKSLRKISDGYLYYDKFISSIPVDVFTDKYGTLEEKIQGLDKKDGKDAQELISLSLCYLFKGDTDRAIDLLFQAKKRGNSADIPE